MASVVFLQDHWYEAFGPMFLSAVLKRAGHDCRLLIGKRASDFLGSLRRLRPQIVALTTISGRDTWAVEVARAVKCELDCLTVLGGPHATFVPEIVWQAGVDAVCRGEGEQAILELAALVDSGASPEPVDNLWLKRGRELLKGEPRLAVTDLDDLPFPDRSLYEPYPAITLQRVRPVMVGRGCPFSCAFCASGAMRSIYPHGSPYTRYRSPEAVIEEIVELGRKANFREICFSDDTLTARRKWLETFLPAYASRIGKPYHCLVRIDQMDRSLCRLLADTGCRAVFFGIETADENVRRRLLAKEIADEQIVRGAELLHRQGIRFRTYNIVGLPGETLEQAVATLRLNVDIGADYPSCSICTPYPGTALADMPVQGEGSSGGAGSRRIPASFHSTVSFDGPDASAIVNLQRLFQTVALCPLLLPFAATLCRSRLIHLLRPLSSCVSFVLEALGEGKGVLRLALILLLRRVPFTARMGRRRVSALPQR